MSHLLANVTHFVRVLRGLGLPVTSGDAGALARALGLVGLSDRETVRSAGRALLVRRREHIATYDRAFDLFWTADRGAGRLPPDLGSAVRRGHRRSDIVALEETGGRHGGGPDDAEEGPSVRQLTWSDRERLRHKDFAELTAEEARDVRALVQSLTLRLPLRHTRRTTPDRNGARPDLRATIRRSLRHGGHPDRLLRRRRRERPRPLVLLCDVSGSMAAYSRVLLQWVYTVGQTAEQVESFAFGTRLTRLTRQLRQRCVNDALRQATEAIVDWGGGTRIGESVRAFNYHWGRRLLRRGAVVVIISDGWDRGDPALLRHELARLRRSCSRIVWLNPLMGAPDYAPLTAGLLAASAHVDDFLPVHNLVSLEQLAGVLANLDRRRPDPAGHPSPYAGLNFNHTARPNRRGEASPHG